MTAKHSPFPWTRENNLSRLMDADGNDVLFANIVEGFDHDDNARANTRLVEAIPAMLEALRTVDAAITDDDMAAVARAHASVRAALEKATGR